FVPPQANIGWRNFTQQSFGLNSKMCQKLVNRLVVAPVRANLDISPRAFEPFKQVGARRTEMQRLAHCALVHLGNPFAAVTLRQASLTGFFRSGLPFLG